MEVHVDCGTCRWHLLRPRRMQLKQSGAASQIWSTVKSWAPSNFIRHFPLLSNAGFSGKVRPSKLHNCFICFSMSSRPFWFLRYPLASLAMSWFGWPAAWARLDGLSAAFFAAGFAGIFGCLRRGGSEAAISAAWPLHHGSWLAEQSKCQVLPPFPKLRRLPPWAWSWHLHNCPKEGHLTSPANHYMIKLPITAGTLPTKWLGLSWNHILCPKLCAQRYKTAFTK